MIRTLLVFFVLGVSISKSWSQVGINTVEPKATLDIRASSQNLPLADDGILIPVVDQFSAVNPTTDQDRMLVFVNGNNAAVQRGFYYWDNASSRWIPFVRQIDDLIDGKSDMDGSDNGSSIFLGIDAGKVDSATDNRNIGLGYNALISTTEGENNVGIGFESLFENIDGSNNVAIGSRSLYSNDFGFQNTAIGNSALFKNITGKNNVAIGFEASTLNEIGNDNVAIGVAALKSNISGSNNIALGRGAMEGNLDGFHNVAIGFQSLNSNTNGNQNVTVGYASMKTNQTGTFNAALGYEAMTNNDSGKENVAIGARAMQGNISGSNNAVVGLTALYSSTTGKRNVVMGRSAALKLNGDDNVMLGFESGFESLTGKGNVFLGTKAGREELGSDLLYIENSNSLTPLIGGNFISNRVGINRPVNVLSNTFEVGGTASKTTAGSWVANSDRRLKKNIKTISGESALSKLQKMRGVSYEWNDTQTGIIRPEGLQYGFVAQELMEVFPSKVTKDAKGFYQTAYGDYDAFFVQAIQELTDKLNEKDAKIKELEDRILAIENMLKK